eukprot:6356636-Amphidinium_carterae.1
MAITCIAACFQCGMWSAARQHDTNLMSVADMATAVGGLTVLIAAPIAGCDSTKAPYSLGARQTTSAEWECQRRPACAGWPAFLLQPITSSHSTLTVFRVFPRPCGVLKDLWEKVLGDKESQDLSLECTDGDATAHAHVLAAASPVVAAMLSSGITCSLASYIS